MNVKVKGTVLPHIYIFTSPMIRAFCVNHYNNIICVKHTNARKKFAFLPSESDNSRRSHGHRDSESQADKDEVVRNMLRNKEICSCSSNCTDFLTLIALCTVDNIGSVRTLNLHYGI